MSSTAKDRQASKSKEEERAITLAEYREDAKQRRADNEFKRLTANRFVIGYLIFIGSAILLAGLSLFIPMRGTVSELKDIILTISAIFSGPLGLIIGYFYRAEQEGK